MSNHQPVAESWKFCPRCGAEADVTGRNPFHCNSCGHTHYFSPVTAVGAITTDADGNVMLLIRAKDPGKGKFGLPGGFVDPGESAEDALRREVFEEVCLQVTRLTFLATFPNSYEFAGTAIPVTDLFFIAEVQSFDGIAVQDGEIAAWHFCRPGPSELGNMAFESNRLALEKYLQQRTPPT
ncbi:MAG: NUDIX domain-containing protein [Planctomycetaceae bacterium]